MGKPVQMRSDKLQLVLEVGRCRAGKRGRDRERGGEAEQEASHDFMDRP